MKELSPMEQKILRLERKLRALRVKLNLRTRALKKVYKGYLAPTGTYFDWIEWEGEAFDALKD